MAVKLKVVLVLLMACTLAGFVGAYCAALLLSRRSPKLIQAQHGYPRERAGFLLSRSVWQCRPHHAIEARTSRD